MSNPWRSGTVRMSICCVFGVMLCACRSMTDFESKWTEAQREREVLRDAYEAQQLRLKEVESRLLRIEDRGLSSSQKPQRLNESATQVSVASVRKKNGYKWSQDRLRALPVVMVKRDARGEQSVDKEVNRPYLSRTQKTSKPVKKSKKYAPNKVRIGSSQSNKAKAVPSLTRDNISKFRDLDQIEEKVSLQSVPSSVPSSLSLKETGPLPKMKRIETEASKAPSTFKEKSQAKTSSTIQDVTALPASKSPQKMNETPVSVGKTTTLDREEQLLRQAQSLREKGRLKDSMRSIQRLISESPTHVLIPEALYLMGRLQIDSGETSIGRSTLLRLSRLYPHTKAAKKARLFLR